MMPVQSATALHGRKREGTLWIPLDARGPRTLQVQLYEGIRSEILGGALKPGFRVPSSRALAEDLGISRTTVLLAIERLVAEGYLVARAASGTRVAEQLPEELLHARRAPVVSVDSVRGRPRLSRRARALLAVPEGGERVGAAPRAFRIGTPAVDEFPVALWARLTARWQRRVSARALDYGEPGGYAPLRASIAAHVASRGMRVAPEQVFVTHGAQHALELVARMLLDPGDAVWCEEPGYPGARSALVAAGLELVPVEVDREGLEVEHAKRIRPGARMAYVTPSHQYPLGVSMSLARRLALLDWARRSKAWILEDDYDSEFRYAQRPLPALQGLDGAGRVLYVGTFSKTLFPALRVGFLIVPPALVESLVRLRRSADSAPATLTQAVLAEFMEAGHYARHVRRMRKLYGERLELLANAVPRFCGKALRLRQADTGLHVVGDLAPGLDEDEVVQGAAAAGIEVAALGSYRMRRGSAPPALVLGFGAVGHRKLLEATRILGDVLAQLA